MDNKDKAIEEMAKDWDYVAHMLRFNDRYMLSLKQWSEPAREMIKLGWIKPTENSVVISREEHEILVKTAQGKIGNMKSNEFIKACLLSGWAIQAVSTEEQVKQARKETAEKILNEIRGYYPIDLEHCDKSEAFILELCYELAEQFGVEIKE